MSDAPFAAWVGRSETRRDVITSAPLRGLSAALDREEAWESGEIPPLAHWLYFLPTTRQSELGEDGHPRRGGFLPPVELPRRMWAAGRLRFHAPLCVGDAVERVSTIKSVAEKAGASGPLVFVTIAHAISANGVVAIEEEQHIVYRGEVGAARTPAPVSRVVDRERAFAPDSTLLFRYSALTFNAHRIHYDAEYARTRENYPGLVVQGPLIATLLIDHHVSAHGAPCSFTFRAERPLFAGEKAKLCADGGALWCANAAGEVVMSAEAR